MNVSMNVSMSMRRKNMNKRNLSIFLVMLMCLSLFPLSVGAINTSSVNAIYTNGVVAVTGTGFASGASYAIRVVDTTNSSVTAIGQGTADGNGNISLSITTGALGTLTNYSVYTNGSEGTLVGTPVALHLGATSTYNNGVVSISGTGYSSATSYTVRVVDMSNSSIKAMGQAVADGNGTISISITTGILATLANLSLIHI